MKQNEENSQKAQKLTLEELENVNGGGGPGGGKKKFESWHKANQGDSSSNLIKGTEVFDPGLDQRPPLDSGVIRWICKNGASQSRAPFFFYITWW